MDQHDEELPAGARFTALRTLAGRAALLLAAVLLGYAVRYGVEILEEMREPVVVPESRMNELTSGPCPRSVGEDAPEFSVARALLEDPPSARPALEIRVLKERGGCAFEWMGRDSLLSGRGLVRFTEDKTAIADLAFFNWLDTRLLRSHEPSFVVSFFNDNGVSFAHDSLRDRLQIVSSRHPLRGKTASRGGKLARAD